MTRRAEYKGYAIVETLDASGRVLDVWISGQSGSFSSVQHARDWLDEQETQKPVEMPALPRIADEQKPPEHRGVRS